MLPNNLKKEFNSILMLASIISLIIVWPLINQNGASGAAQTFLATEIFVTTCMGLYLWNNGHLKGSEKNEI
jgi:uncharacterized membrane protein YozB (DUF420 family)